jgi:hypothetical protein
MTPKEKATELSNKYFEQFLAFGEYLSIGKANECALIAVDEILKENLELPDEPETIVRYLFWQEVKQEIEAL